MAFTDNEIKQILDAFLDMTTERQYIGARYVPIFGRKDEQSILWDNTAPYEPLTIVLYQGNSYTSRQYVPVGVEIDNEEFWALTGNYNAQVEQYRREVLALGETVEAAVEAVEEAVDTVEEMSDTVDQLEIDVDSILSNAVPFVDVIYSGFYYPAHTFVTVLKMPKSKMKLIPFAVGNNLPNLIGDYDYNNSTEYAQENTENTLIFNLGLQAPTICNNEIKAQTASSDGLYWNILAFDDNGNITILPDPNHEYNATQLQNLGYKNTTGVFEMIVSNGSAVDQSVFTNMSNYEAALYGCGARMCFGWDNDNYYVMFCDGRQPFNKGVTHNDCYTLATELGIRNLVNGDGGGSVQLYMPNNGSAFTTIAETTIMNGYFNGAQRRSVPILFKIEMQEGE